MGWVRRSDPDRQRRQLQRALWIIDQAIDLYPAAEAVIRACREDDPKTGLLAAEAGEVRERYRRLREAMDRLELPPWLAGKLASVLDHHLRLVSLALDLSYRRQTERIRMQRHRLHGVGPSADDLLDLRVRIVDVLGQQWRPTQDRQGDEDGHRR